MGGTVALPPGRGRRGTGTDGAAPARTLEEVNVVDQLRPTRGGSDDGLSGMRGSSARHDADRGRRSPVESVLGPVVARLEASPLGAMAAKVGWTLGDQALSSLTNFALNIVLTNILGNLVYAYFVIAYSTFTLIIGTTRALIADPLVIKFSAARADVRHEAVRRAAGTAVGIGALCGVICAVAAAVLRGDTGAALLALALSLPGLLLQDTWRFAFFAAGTPSKAAANDLVWAVVQFTLIGLFVATGQATLFLVTLSWGIAATVASLYGMVQLRMLPRVSATRRWFTENWNLSTRLGTDFLVNQGAVTLTVYLIPVLASSAALSNVRNSQNLLGPLSLAFTGISAFVLPVYGRRVADQLPLLRPAMLTSAVLGTVTVVWGALIYLLPDSVWSALIDPTNWAGAQTTLLPILVQTLSVALAVGASLSLKALSRASLLMRVTFVQGPLILVLGCLGAWLDGGRGAGYGMMTAQLVGLVLTWLMLVTHRTPGDEVDPATTGSIPAV